MTEVEKLLIIIDGTGRVQEVSLNDLNKERFYWGRETEKNDIVTISSVVSRNHGKFKMAAEGLLYADLGSTNGTYVEDGNGRRFLQSAKSYTRLKDGDMLRVQAKDGEGESVLLLYRENICRKNLKEESQNKKWQKYALQNGSMTIGRGKENDIVLDHPGVSRVHAIIEKNGEDFYIADNRSKNGVLVNGHILYEKRKLHEKDVIRILNGILLYTGGNLFYKCTMQGVSLNVRHINKTVAKGKKILDDVSLDIESNEFVAIIGGSGAGKTTLMNAVSGFDRKKTGKVLFSGMDLNENFSILKNLIGYVPQQDIIYENLTLKKMLIYTAKLKMPKDTSKEEIDKRIAEVLEMVELFEHQDTYIRKLSGGQKKRASIAVELLADPSLFFLDEPTSGLDPGTEKKLMQTLSRLSKSQGKTIVMVTHTTQSLDLCDKVIFMGQGGRMCFCGTCEEAKMFFDTDNLVDIYNQMAAQPKVWAEQYRRCVPLSEVQESEKQKELKKRRTSGLRQLGILTMRYAELIKNDLPRLTMLLLQPIIIAALLGIVAAEDVFDIYESTKTIFFALSCAGIWIGLFNSIQEICKERVILRREYMGNMKLWSYTLSKFLIQLILGAIQALIMTAVFKLSVGIPEEGLLFEQSFLEVFVTTWLTIIAAMALGFVVSAIVKSGDKAMTCAPFVLIIQLLFSGILFELKGAGKKIAYLTISKWSVESYGSIAHLNKLTTRMQEAVPGTEHEVEKIFEFSKPHLLQHWGVLLGMVVLCGILTSLILRGVSKDGR